MRLFDTFLFADELDLLECRLSELDRSPVYRHVLVEAPVDHRGRPKPLWFAENKDRFAAWSDRIVHVVAEEMPTAPWDAVNYQREQTARGLAGAAGDDVIVHGDVDEIPAAAAIRSLLGTAAELPCYLAQRWFMFAVDWEYPVPGDTLAAARARQVTSFCGLRDGGWPRVAGGGWHLSWLGGPEAIAAKARAYAHVEIDEYLRGCPPYVCYENGFGWVSRTPGELLTPLRIRLRPVDVDDSWPEWIAARRCPPVWFRPR